MWLGIGVKIVNWWRSLAAAANGPFSNHATLTDGLVSYWKLEETSGVRYDSVTASANDLTDNNTVTASLAGPSGTVAQFTAANSEYLDRASTIPRDGSSWTTAFWVYITDPGAGTQRWYMSQGNQTIWVAKYNSDLAIDIVGGGESYKTVSIATEPAGWFFVVAGYDGSDDKAFLSYNAAAIAKPAGTSTGVTTDANFQLGRVSGGGAGTVYYDGTMGRVGLWDGVMDAAEITSLFNSGNGKSYADLTAAELTGLVSYWNLDEASGTRADSHGANDLTDNNTVTSVNSGPSGTVAQFTAANSEYLQDTVTVADPSAYTAVVWVNRATATTAIMELQNLFYHLPGAGTYAYGTGDGIIAGFAPTEDSKWHMIAFRSDAGTVKASEDAGTVFTRAVDQSAISGTQKIAFGAFDTGTFASTSQQGRAGLWDRALSDADLTALFNSGNGKSYADLTTDEKVGLVSYWNLDETSGNRADSHGSNTLTDNNTVTSVVNAGGAMRNVAASFVAANSESLSRTNFSPLTETITRSLSFWFKGPATGYTGLLTVGATPGEASPTYQLNFENNKLRIVHMGALVTGLTTITDGTWYLGILTYDHALGQLRVYVNDTLELSENTAETTAYVDTNFYLGTSATGYWNRLIDEVGVWSRVLTAQERTDLYNAGAGLFY